MTAQTSIEDCIAAVRKGGVIAYPTEGVWGVGCDPRDEAAVMRLLALKQREVDKGLILVAANEAQLAGYIDLSALDAEAIDAIRAGWPGPNTWIVPAAPDAPPLVVELPPLPSRPTTLKGMPWLDLASHPWAGQPVTFRVLVWDEIGQKSESAEQSVVLPERVFTDPAALAVIS